MNVFVFLADGFEEIEGLTVVDLLRRAEIDTTTVSIMEGKEVNGAHGIKVSADKTFEEIKDQDLDMIVLPGGMPGTLNLQAHKGLEEKILANAKEDRYLAAICAAPSVFAALGLLDGKVATSYPSFEEALSKSNYVYDPVAVDGKIITSRGMGTAILFGAKLIEIIKGKEKADEVLESIVY